MTDSEVGTPEQEPARVGEDQEREEMTCEKILEKYRGLVCGKTFFHGHWAARQLIAGKCLSGSEDDIEGDLLAYALMLGLRSKEAKKYADLRDHLPVFSADSRGPWIIVYGYGRVNGLEFKTRRDAEDWIMVHGVDFLKNNGYGDLEPVRMATVEPDEYVFSRPPYPAVDAKGGPAHGFWIMEL